MTDHSLELHDRLSALQSACEGKCDQNDCKGSDGGCFPCWVWVQVDEVLMEVDELREKIKAVQEAAKGLGA